MDKNVRYDRLILLMDATELEKFCRAWVENKSGYSEVKRFAGTGDMGRDVVGFLSDKRHEGEWDNYQCKQYSKTLDLNQGLLAVGKVLYWASQGQFTAPKDFYFVAPKGVARKFELLIDRPAAFKKMLLSQWDSACAESITKKKSIPIDKVIMATINAYNFSNIKVIGIDDLMKDPAVKPLLIKEFGADPGKYPAAAVPTDVQDTEMRYIDELLFAYSERANVTFSSHAEISKDENFGPDIRIHRERFFEADAFEKFYRDNTAADVISSFRKDIHYGVIDRWKLPATDTLARVGAVMEQAGLILPAGPLAKYAHVSVRQGVCHHIVNDGELSWRQKK